MRNSNRLARLERVAGPDLAGVDVTQLTDAELEALIATIPPAERERLAKMTDAELETIAHGTQ